MDLKNKRVLVIGLGLSGRAAAELLLRRGARVVAVDGAASDELRRSAARLDPAERVVPRAWFDAVPA